MLISEDAMKRKCRHRPFGVIHIYTLPPIHIISMRWNLHCWWLHSTDENTEAKSQETRAKAGVGVKSNSQIAWFYSQDSQHRTCGPPFPHHHRQHQGLFHVGQGTFVSSVSVVIQQYCNVSIFMIIIFILHWWKWLRVLPLAKIIWLSGLQQSWD